MNQSLWCFSNHVQQQKRQRWGKAAHHRRKCNSFPAGQRRSGERTRRRFRERCHPILVGKGGHGCCSGNSLRHISCQASKKGAWEIRGLTDCSSSVHPSRDRELRDATFRKNHSRVSPVGLRPAKTARVSFADLFFSARENQRKRATRIRTTSDPTDRISQIGRRYWSSNQRDLRYSSLCSCGLSSQTARSLGWRRSANAQGWLLTFFFRFQHRLFPLPLCTNRSCARQNGETGGTQGGVWRCMRRCCVSQT